VHGDERLTKTQAAVIEANETNTIEPTQLPGEFHRDPADQIIVATARAHGCPLVTSDSRLLRYPHIETIW